MATGGSDVRSDIRHIGRVALPLYLSMIVEALAVRWVWARLPGTWPTGGGASSRGD